MLRSAHLYRLHAASLNTENDESGMLYRQCLALASPRLAPRTQGSSLGLADQMAVVKENL